MHYDLLGDPEGFAYPQYRGTYRADTTFQVSRVVAVRLAPAWRLPPAAP